MKLLEFLIGGAKLFYNNRYFWYDTLNLQRINYFYPN